MCYSQKWLPLKYSTLHAKEVTSSGAFWKLRLKNKANSSWPGDYVREEAVPSRDCININGVVF